MQKNIVPGKGIEITRQDKRVVVSQTGIEIRREGKAVSIESFEGGLVYLVVDCSGSMAGDKLSQAKRGALNFAKDALAKGYLTGLIKFHSSATKLCEPLKEISLLGQSLNGIELGDGTYMAEAIRLAHQLLKDKKGNRVMVIATDGMPNGSNDPDASLKAAEMAKNDGIDIIAIGTDDADKDFLKKLASRSDLGIKVTREHFEESIISSVNLLGSGK